MAIVDLEELLNDVRDRSSREYYREAIRAYHARAYRAAVVSIWVTVVYDLVSKIRELAAGGDKEAKRFIQKVDRAREENDIRAQQEFEQSILDTAYETFELISNQELKDLERLMSDRHRCAHPAYHDERLLFTPSAELVRAHLVHAVTHVLRNEPVQGKAALQRLLTDLTDDTFPSVEEQAIAFVTEKYLRRSKESLRRNLVVVLLKTLLRRDVPAIQGKEQNAAHALTAVRRSHPQEFERVVREQLNRVLEGLKGMQLWNVGTLLKVDQRVWQWLEEPNRLRVQEVVGQLDPPPTLYEIDGFMLVGELAERVLKAVGELDVESKINLIGASPHSAFETIAAQVYREESASFRGSESLAQAVITPLLPNLTAAGVQAVLDAVLSNRQIRYASGTPPLIERMFDLTRPLLSQTGAYWKAFAEAVLEDEEPEDHYSYPEVRERLEAEGIAVDYPEREDNMEGEDEEDLEDALPF